MICDVGVFTELVDEPGPYCVSQSAVGLIYKILNNKCKYLPKYTTRGTTSNLTVGYVQCWTSSPDNFSFSECFYAICR